MNPPYCLWGSGKQHELFTHNSLDLPLCDQHPEPHTAKQQTAYMISGETGSCKTHPLQNECLHVWYDWNAHLRLLVAAFLLRNHGHFPASLADVPWGLVSVYQYWYWSKLGTVPSLLQYVACLIYIQVLARSNYKIKYIHVKMMFTEAHNIHS